MLIFCKLIQNLMENKNTNLLSYAPSYALLIHLELSSQRCQKVQRPFAKHINTVRDHGRLLFIHTFRILEAIDGSKNNKLIYKLLLIQRK